MTAPLPNGLMRHEPIDAIRFPLEPIAPPSLSCVVCETNDAAAFALPLGSLRVRTFGRVLPEGTDSRGRGSLFGGAHRQAARASSFAAKPSRQAPARTSLLIHSRPQRP